MSESDFRDRGAQDEAEQSRRPDESVTGANPGPVDDFEGIAAADGLTSSPEVGEHYREMSEAGSDAQGDSAG